jgi:hypothetical protein
MKELNLNKKYRIIKNPKITDIEVYRRTKLMGVIHYSIVANILKQKNALDNIFNITKNDNYDDIYNIQYEIGASCSCHAEWLSPVDIQLEFSF